MGAGRLKAGSNAAGCFVEMNPVEAGGKSGDPQVHLDALSPIPKRHPTHLGAGPIAQNPFDRPGNRLNLIATQRQRDRGEGSSTARHHGIFPGAGGTAKVRVAHCER